MAELLDNIRGQIGERLEELRPFVDELARLEQALAALEHPESPPGSTTSAPVPQRRRTGRPRGAGKDKRDATERDDLRERTLTLIAERPGVSKTELRQQLGLSGPEAGQFLRRLLDAGTVEEQTLPSGTVGYRVPAAPALDAFPEADAVAQSEPALEQEQS